MKTAHTHFCSRCFGPSGVKGVKNKGGWWRCVDKACVKPRAFPCKKHKPTEEEYARARGLWFSLGG